MSFRKDVLSIAYNNAAPGKAFLLSLLLFFNFSALAQETEPQADTISLGDDTRVIITADSLGLPESIMLTEELSTVDPQKATMLSAIVPGLGQIYNGQVWKVPLYYGTFVVLGHMIYTNNRLYNIFRQSYFAEIDGNPATTNKFTRFTENSLKRNTDNFRRNRDYMVIIAGAVYLLNIADAHIGAHLREFDINDELTINYSPTMDTVNGRPYAGVGVTISF